MADQKSNPREKTSLRRRAEARLQGQEVPLNELTPEEIRVLEYRVLDEEVASDHRPIFMVVEIL